MVAPKRPTAALRARYARSAAVLLLIVLGVTGINMLYTAHAVRSNSQQRCGGLEADAHIPLPALVPGNNARKWEATFEAIAAARAAKLGCQPGGKP